MQTRGIVSLRRTPFLESWIPLRTRPLKTFARAAAPTYEASASRKFWGFYQELPTEVRRLADLNYELLKQDPRHPSIHFKKAGRFWSARVGIRYRALAVQENDDFVSFWIGHHSEYDRLLTGK